MLEMIFWAILLLFFPLGSILERLHVLTCLPDKAKAYPKATIIKFICWLVPVGIFIYASVLTHQARSPF